MREPRATRAQYRSKMQTANTQRGNRVISLLVFLILIGYAYPVPLQFLPNIPGYIPVYIRHGDEPLETINPDLAEAFGETSKSVKASLQLPHTLDHVSEHFKDDDIDMLLGESKRKHPSILQVRQAERHSFAKNNESETKDEPKLITIYQLSHDNDRKSRRRHRGGIRRKTSKQHVFKVSPISDAEKEELKKMAIEIEKEETKSNELYTSMPKLPSEKPDRHKVNNFVLKIRDPLDESSTDLSEIHQTTDFSKPLDNHSIEVKEEESVIKKQRSSVILSNVHKVSPIVLSNKSEGGNDNELKNSTEPNDEIAMD